MGHKVSPISFRLGGIQDWRSKWFVKKSYGKILKEDVMLRDYILKKFSSGGISRIDIRRSANQIVFIIHSSRPGIMIGRGGEGAEKLREELKKKIDDPKIEVKVNIEEVKVPWLDANFATQYVKEQLEKRIGFRRTLKQALKQIMDARAKGAKVMVSGRLDGAEMSRKEWLAQGRLPLHTFRADIDFAGNEANTKYGKVGIKVWIYKGEIFSK